MQDEYTESVSSAKSNTGCGVESKAAARQDVSDPTCATIANGKADIINNLSEFDEAESCERSGSATSSYANSEVCCYVANDDIIHVANVESFQQVEENYMKQMERVGQDVADDDVIQVEIIRDEPNDNVKQYEGKHNVVCPKYVNTELRTTSPSPEIIASATEPAASVVNTPRGSPQTKRVNKNATWKDIYIKGRGESFIESMPIMNHDQDPADDLSSGSDGHPKPKRSLVGRFRYWREKAEPREVWLMLFMSIVPIYIVHGIEFVSFSMYYVEYAVYFDDATRSAIALIPALRFTSMCIFGKSMY